MFVAVDFFAPFANLLAWLYSIWPSYGGAIVLYTMIIMLLVMPLTLKGTRSMMVLQALQPEMKKLQQQYKDDRQKLNEEMLKFYRENNINPLGGCLPLLIQLPIFLILYRVLRGLTTTGNCGDPAHPFQGFHPQYISSSSKLYQSLYCKTSMDSWGMDLAKSTVTVIGESVWKALPYLVLVVGVAITSFVQQRQISGRNPAAASNPQQQLLMRIGPVMITFFSLVVQAALAIYFFVSNLFRVGQQAIITRTIYNTPEAQKLLESQRKAAEEAKEKNAGKGFFEKLLGDAKPQVGKNTPPRGNPRSKGASGNGTKSKPPAKGDGPAAGDDDASRPRPPGAKANGGRTTPPKPRPASARKKRKRK